MTSLDRLSSELELALSIADVADHITQPAFESRSFTTERKHDHSEVTEIDRGTEKAIVSSLTEARPQHSVFGEEFGVVGDETSDWQWVIDPIDGTSNFVRGVPIWATLIALVHRHEGPVMGVVSAPSLGRRWWSARGSGAFADGRGMRVSNTSSIDQAQVSVTFNSGWERLGLTDRLVQLQHDSYRSRGYGDFWQHMLVAEGAVDIAIDAVGLAPYDNAAVQAVVEEAGGRHTDRSGTRDYTSNTAISSNGILHDEVIRRLC
jgi:histidinol-phosphatase